MDYNGSGRSAGKANIDYFTKRGLKILPSRGPDSALTVPGIVSMWKTLNRDFGTMEIKDLIKPAMIVLEDGGRKRKTMGKVIKKERKKRELIKR